MSKRWERSRPLKWQPKPHIYYYKIIYSGYGWNLGGLQPTGQGEEGPCEAEEWPGEVGWRWGRRRTGLCWHSLVHDDWGTVCFSSEVFIPLLSRVLCRALDLKYVNHTKLQANSTFNFQFKLTALQCVTWGTFIQLCPVRTSFATGSESSLRAQSSLWSVNISLTIPNTRYS